MHLCFVTIASIITAANEVWGKVIFSEACVKNSVHRGVPAPGGGWGGMPGLGGAWCGGPAPGGCLFRGGVPAPVGCLVETTSPGRLLLWVVRILLECILVFENANADIDAKCEWALSCTQLL